MAYNFTFEYPHASSYRRAGGPSNYLHNQDYRANSSRIQLPSVHAAFGDPFMPSLSNGQAATQESQAPLTSDPSFDILDWHPAYQSCQRYFLDHAQHEQATQALCALINIRLPFQYPRDPVVSSRPLGSASPAHANPASSNNGNHAYSYPPSNNTSSRNGNQHPHPAVSVSLIPYIRRLVVTGFDKPAILHGFFGDDYNRGILPHLDCERRNYLFAAKQGGWRNCKTLYDSGSGTSADETVPFLSPLDGAKMEELVAAEKAWNSWQKMEDWSLGSRATAQVAGERDQRTPGPPELGGIAAGSGESQRVADNLPDSVLDTFEGQENVG